MSKKEIKNMHELVKKPELYLGIATLIIVGIFVVKAVYKPITKAAFPTVTSIPLRIVSPTKAVEAEVIAQKTEVKKDIKQIKKFADTGSFEVYVKKGDSFWTVAEQVCGNGIFSDVIKDQNGYGDQSLQPGDKLTISCD